MLRLSQGMWLCHMLVCMVMVMLMVVVDGELWRSSWVYVLVWEVMLHHGKPQGVVREVMLTGMVEVMGPNRREGQRNEAWGRRHL